MSSRLSTLGAAASPQLRGCPKSNKTAMLLPLLLLLVPATADVIIDSVIHSYVVNCVPVALPGADPVLTTPALDKNGPGCRAAKRAALAKFDGKADALRAFEDSLATPRWAMEPKAAWKRFQATEQHVYPKLEEVDPKPPRHPIGSTHLFRKFLEGEVTPQRPRPLGRSHSMPHLTAVKTATGFVQEEETAAAIPTNGGQGPLPFLENPAKQWPCRTIPVCIHMDPNSCTADESEEPKSPFGITFQALVGAAQLLAPTGVKLWPANMKNLCECQSPSHTTFHILRITDNPGKGCQSFIGMEKEPGQKHTTQVLQVDTEVVNSYMLVHELLHTLGFAHMHQRADRDDYITVEAYKQAPICTTNFDRLDHFKYKGEYEYQSVMHYAVWDVWGCTSGHRMFNVNNNWVQKGTLPTCFDGPAPAPPKQCNLDWELYHKLGSKAKSKSPLSQADLNSVTAIYANKPEFGENCFFNADPIQHKVAAVDHHLYASLVPTHTVPESETVQE